MSRRRVLLAVLAAVALLAVITNLPTTTRVGIDFVQTEQRLPLYEKAIAFLDRDIQMRALATRAAGDARGQRERAVAILRWTHEHVRPVPPGFPVIDDHPLNILIRGYGTVDQAADAFANLATYAGVPAKFVYSRRGDRPVGLLPGRCCGWDNVDERMVYAFALVELDGTPRLFDVREGIAFTTRSGGLATVAELRADPSLTADLPPPAEGRGLGYPELIAGIVLQEGRRVSDQMPLERIAGELGRLIGR